MFLLVPYLAGALIFSRIVFTRMIYGRDIQEVYVGRVLRNPLIGKGFFWCGCVYPVRGEVAVSGDMPDRISPGYSGTLEHWKAEVGGRRTLFGLAWISEVSIVLRHECIEFLW